MASIYRVSVKELRGLRKLAETLDDQAWIDGDADAKAGLAWLHELLNAKQAELRHEGHPFLAGDKVRLSAAGIAHFKDAERRHGITAHTIGTVMRMTRDMLVVVERPRLASDVKNARLAHAYEARFWELVS